MIGGRPQYLQSNISMGGVRELATMLPMAEAVLFADVVVADDLSVSEHCAAAVDDDDDELKLPLVPLVVDLAA